MKHRVRTLAGSMALAALSLGSFGSAGAASDHRTFEGTITHISANNIKVKGIEGGKTQELSFEYVPRLGKLTHNGGKVTRDQRMLHVGEYVQVTYDQKLMGLRHADDVEPYANPAMKMKN